MTTEARIAPSNLPWANPEVLEATLREGGANLIRGGVNLVLTLRFVGAEPVTFRGVRVVYDYEGRTYTYTDATTLQLCSEDCPG